MQVPYFLPDRNYPDIIKPESIQSFFAGENISFSCEVKEWVPPITVKWLKNNMILKETKSQLDVVRRLDFPELDLHDTGKYTCEASDHLITKKHTFFVNVSCKHIQCEFYNGGHLHKVDQWDYRKITIHSERVRCGQLAARKQGQQ